MTDREKMIEIVLDTEITGIKLRNITGGISTANAIADAFIAANIGDMKERKFEADHYWRMWQGSLVELERAERRADVAHRAFDNTIKAFQETLSAFFPDEEIDLDKWKKQNLANAEKELAEESGAKKEI